MAPSEVAGIGCELCAYCFDEALVVRERAHAAAGARQQARAQEATASIDAHRERAEAMRRQLRGE